MFSKTPTYRSSAVGEFQGDVEINDMMQQFFRNFPDVRWRLTRLH